MLFESWNKRHDLKHIRATRLTLFCFQMTCAPFPSLLLNHWRGPPPSFYRKLRLDESYLWPQSLWVSGLRLVPILRAAGSPSVRCYSVIPGHGLGTSKHCFCAWASHITWVFHVSVWDGRSPGNRNEGRWSQLALSSFSCLPIVLRSLGVHEARPDRVHAGGAAWHGLHHCGHGQRGQGEARCEYCLHPLSDCPSQPDLPWAPGGTPQPFYC